LRSTETIKPTVSRDGWREMGLIRALAVAAQSSMARATAAERDSHMAKGDPLAPALAGPCSHNSSASWQQRRRTSARCRACRFQLGRPRSRPLVSATHEPAPFSVVPLPLCVHRVSAVPRPRPSTAMRIRLLIFPREPAQLWQSAEGCEDGTAETRWTQRTNRTMAQGRLFGHVRAPGPARSPIEQIYPA